MGIRGCMRCDMLLDVNWFFFVLHFTIKSKFEIGNLLQSKLSCETRVLQPKLRLPAPRYRYLKATRVSRRSLSSSMSEALSLFEFQTQLNVVIGSADGGTFSISTGGWWGIWCSRLENWMNVWLRDYYIENILIKLSLSQTQAHTRQSREWENGINLKENLLMNGAIWLLIESTRHFHFQFKWQR